MAVLSDASIKALCQPPYAVPGEAVRGYPEAEITGPSPVDNQGRPMIKPFVGELVRENDHGTKIISYGLSSYGYDVRLQKDNVKIFTNVNNAIVDPMAPDERCYIDAEIHTTDSGIDYFILPPNSYALGATMEYFCIPRNVTAICVGKSTYARSCLGVNVTPIEAGFEGEVVIEVSNGSTLPVKVYLGTGIAQFLFLMGDKECVISYGDGNRKYQGQQGITLSRV